MRLDTWMLLAQASLAFAQEYPPQAGVRSALNTRPFIEPLAEARDVFDVKHQFHGDLPGSDALCRGMDQYVRTTVRATNSTTRSPGERST